MRALSKISHLLYFWSFSEFPFPGPFLLLSTASSTTWVPNYCRNRFCLLIWDKYSLYSIDCHHTKSPYLSILCSRIINELYTSYSTVVVVLIKTTYMNNLCIYLLLINHFLYSARALQTLDFRWAFYCLRSVPTLVCLSEIVLVPFLWLFCFCFSVCLFVCFRCEKMPIKVTEWREGVSLAYWNSIFFLQSIFFIKISHIYNILTCMGTIYCWDKIFSIKAVLNVSDSLEITGVFTVLNEAMTTGNLPVDWDSLRFQHSWFFSIHCSKVCISRGILKQGLLQTSQLILYFKLWLLLVFRYHTNMCFKVYCKLWTFKDSFISFRKI